MQFNNVVIQSLTAVDAPVKMTSAEIGERLQPAMERLGIRPGLIEDISGIMARRFWNHETQPSDAATMAAEQAIEEAGILSALFNAPTASEQNIVRESGREGSEGAAMYYPEGALTFEQRLEQEYGYPAVPREMSDAPENIRNQRPRHDMPTFQELEDARAHVLMSAEMAKQFGPETATKLGNFAEGIDSIPIPIIGNATPEDVAMDKRNNAFGVKLLKEAGVKATPAEIAKMVDDKVFEQLDQILGREPGSRSFRSPSTGIDVYFPRNEEGYFQTSRSGYY